MHNMFAAHQQELDSIQVDSAQAKLCTVDTNTSSRQANLLVLAPRGPLFERGDVPQSQTAREVDEREQGAVGAQAHTEHAVLDVAKTNRN